MSACLQDEPTTFQGWVPNLDRSYDGWDAGGGESPSDGSESEDSSVQRGKKKSKAITRKKRSKSDKKKRERRASSSTFAAPAPAPSPATALSPLQETPPRGVFGLSPPPQKATRRRARSPPHHHQSPSHHHQQQQEHFSAAPSFQTPAAAAAAAVSNPFSAFLATGAQQPGSSSGNGMSESSLYATAAWAAPHPGHTGTHLHSTLPAGHQHNPAGSGGFQPQQQQQQQH
mmetsp:Transcript_40809/g.80080  ORF Transcript_40809/g.80080 Transcript_40809/m.80080 type:complete len:229 (-) Transcript_40809:540-1226(-)